MHSGGKRAPPSEASVAQGAPVAAGGAHLQPHLQGQLTLLFMRVGMGIQQPLLAQPLQGSFQGLLPALEGFIQHRMGEAAGIGEPVEAPGRGETGVEHGHAANAPSLIKAAGGAGAPGNRGW